MDTPIKILFLAANPIDTPQLRLDEEIRAIDQALRQAKFRDRFDIRQHWAVRVSELQECFLRHEPHIVHFSGHGSESSEIILEDQSGKQRSVSVRAFEQLFSVLKDNIRCVVLNGCYSESQGMAIAKHIDCVVGMSGAVGDSVATVFAASFYRALGYGRDVQTAFDLGCLEIDWHSLSEQDKPRLIATRADPKAVFFVTEAQAATAQAPDHPTGGRSLASHQPVTRRVEFTIQVGDVTTYSADVLALKFAEGLFGADKAVTGALGKTFDDIQKAVPSLDMHKTLATHGRIAARQVLYLNVGNLFDFDYADIRKFAAEVLHRLAGDAPLTRHLAMTIHGPGYGLDEAEALRSQLAGCLDAFDAGLYPPPLERITIIERNPDRAQRLLVVLNDAIPGGSVSFPETIWSVPPSHSPAVQRSPLTSHVGRESAQKPHVFVAISFTDEMEDVYYFGIQDPVNAAGFLCEKADLTASTSEILDRIKTRIEAATLVIAELSTISPGVFLQVGFAWGRERPTILVFREREKLPLDIRGQRCVQYRTIRELKDVLTEELGRLKERIA